MKVYVHQNCETCRRALKWLNQRGIKFSALPVREQPPTVNELKRVLEVYGGEARRLFNTSGQDYRKLGLKTKLAKMTTEEMLDLLSRHGNLVKRPFVVTTKGGLVGFDEDDWEKLA